MSIIFHRKSLRLKNFDYSTPAAYFVTIRIEKCGYLFGEVIDEQIILNPLGLKAKEHWLNITDHYPNVLLDEFIIMPNHIHGIILLFESGNNVRKNTKINTKDTSSGVRKNAIDNMGESNSSGVRKNAINNFYSQLSSKKGTLSVIIREFKSSFTLWCRKNGHESFKWQRRFYDRIIRNEKELNNIRGYIMNNPIKWT